MIQRIEGEYLITEYPSGAMTMELNNPAPPIVQTTLTRLQFLNLFTDAELAGIYTAAKTVVAIEIMLDKFRAAEFIDKADLQTIGGVTALETAGLIAAGRAAQILA